MYQTMNSLYSSESITGSYKTDTRRCTRRCNPYCDGTRCL